MSGHLDLGTASLRPQLEDVESKDLQRLAKELTRRQLRIDEEVESRLRENLYTQDSKSFVEAQAQARAEDAERKATIYMSRAQGYEDPEVALLARDQLNRWHHEAEDLWREKYAPEVQKLRAKLLEEKKKATPEGMASYGERGLLSEVVLRAPD